MNVSQTLINDMMDDMLKGWNDGTVSPLFPREDAGTTPAGLIINASLNAMAYGYEHGLEQGLQLAKDGG